MWSGTHTPTHTLPNIFSAKQRSFLSLDLCVLQRTQMLSGCLRKVGEPGLLAFHTNLWLFTFSLCAAASAYFSFPPLTFAPPPGWRSERGRLHRCCGQHRLQMVGIDGGDASAEGRRRGGDWHPGGQHNGEQSLNGKCRPCFLLAKRPVICLISFALKEILYSLP